MLCVSVEVIFSDYSICSSINAKSLDQVREIMYNLPKYVPIKRMPPNSRAFHFHMLRIYLQVNTWKHLKLTLDIEKFGFYKDADGYFAPTISDRDYAPEYLLKEVKCNCQMPNKESMLCTKCSCVKHGVPCTALCKCHGECSHNE